MPELATPPNNPAISARPSEHREQASPSLRPETENWSPSESAIGGGPSFQNQCPWVWSSVPWVMAAGISAARQLSCHRINKYTCKHTSPVITYVMVTIVYTTTQKVHGLVVANWLLVTEEEVHCHQLLLGQTWTPKHMFCLLVCKQADAGAKGVHGRTRGRRWVM